MDRPVEDRGPDTIMLELKPILDCLVTNGYEFEGTREANIGRYSYPDDFMANFSKKLHYRREDGDNVPDDYIQVYIKFSKNADYTNFKHFGKDQDERQDDNEYIGDPDTFIRGLMGEEDFEAQARGVTRGKKTKTRRNKRKISNRRKK